MRTAFHRRADSTIGKGGTKHRSSNHAPVANRLPDIFASFYHNQIINLKNPASQLTHHLEPVAVSKRGKVDLPSFLVDRGSVTVRG
jgi:hypothetical protein